MSYTCLQVIFKERAVKALTERLHVSLTSTQASAREQLEKHFETQTELQQRGIQLRMTVEPRPHPFLLLRLHHVYKSIGGKHEVILLDRVFG